MCVHICVCVLVMERKAAESSSFKKEDLGHIRHKSENSEHPPRMECGEDFSSPQSDSQFGADVLSVAQRRQSLPGISVNSAQ